MSEQNDPYLQNIPQIKDTLNYSINDEIVTIALANDKPIQRFCRKLGFKIAPVTNVAFDDYSSFIFQHIDGENNIYQIGQLLHAKYGVDAEPLYERLVIFIDFLEDDKKWILFKNKLNT